MQVATSIEIAKPKEQVWAAIADIENSAGMISSILSIEVLEKPEAGLAGFKWTETRKFFGKDATETMWVTEAVENDHYATRAESHGSIYATRLSVAESDGGTLLSMAFSGQGVTLSAKLLSFLMGPFIKGAMEKELQKDLADIKRFVEQA